MSGNHHTTTTETETETHESYFGEYRCSSPGCGHREPFDSDDYFDSRMAETAMERHFEREHCGKARILITLEREIQLYPSQNPSKIVDGMLDDMEGDEPRGYEAAYAAIEVLEEPDYGNKEGDG